MRSRQLRLVFLSKTCKVFYLCLRTQYLGNLSLTEDIVIALLHREGLLGLRLMISKSMEVADFENTEKLLPFTNLSPQQFLQAQKETSAWAKGISETRT
jgi:hypothetical protein